MLTELERPVSFDSALIAIRDPEIRNDLVGLITGAIADVERGDADIIMLAARRMTCLYALLQKEGLQPPRTPGRDTFVVSDRFVELLPAGAWEGKRVILLDDTKVTGFTIRNRTERARRLVGPTGTVSPRVAVNLRGGAFRKPRVDALDLHNQFARAFGTNLVPFFTDFAISREIEIKAALLDRILATREWRTVDVTNQVLFGTGARAFSLFPSGSLATMFAEALGEARHLVDTTKIRLFVDDDFGQLRLRVVPIVLTPALSDASLHSWLDEMRLDSNGTPEQTAHAAGLVTMMLSRALLSVFADFARDEFGLVVEEDRELSRLALGPSIDEIATIGELGTLSRLAAQRKDVDPVRPEPSFVWPGGVAEDGSHYTIAGDDAVMDGYRALVRIRGKRGLRTSLGEIALLSKSNKTAATIAIDVLNDLGYSVPIFAVADGMVFRAYRPGESVRDPAELTAGRMGGKLATLARTRQIPDDTYFGEEILIDSRGLR